jgi:hypothetical protein
MMKFATLSQRRMTALGGNLPGPRRGREGLESAHRRQRRPGLGEIAAFHLPGTRQTAAPGCRAQVAEHWGLRIDAAAIRAKAAGGRRNSEPTRHQSRGRRPDSKRWDPELSFWM